MIWIVLAIGAYWIFGRECECGGSCGPCSSEGTTSVAAAPATGIGPPPGTATAAGTHTSLQMKLCETLSTVGAKVGASAAGVPQAGAVATPGVTSGLCGLLGKGLVAAEHGIVTGAKDVGKAGAAVGQFVGHETATAAKATARVTVTAVKDVAKGAGKVVGALSSGAKGAEHAVSSGIHKVLGWL